MTWISQKFWKAFFLFLFVTFVKVFLSIFSHIELSLSISCFMTMILSFEILQFKIWSHIQNICLKFFGKIQILMQIVTTICSFTSTKLLKMDIHCSIKTLLFIISNQQLIIWLLTLLKLALRFLLKKTYHL